MHMRRYTITYPCYPMMLSHDVIPCLHMQIGVMSAMPSAVESHSLEASCGVSDLHSSSKHCVSRGVSRHAVPNSSAHLSQSSNDLVYCALPFWTQGAAHHQECTAAFPEAAPSDWQYALLLWPSIKHWGQIELKTEQKDTAVVTLTIHWSSLHLDWRDAPEYAFSKLQLAKLLRGSTD